MLLTITNTRSPATDLGFLLAKHPARTQSFNLTFGKAHVFYPEAEDERCTFALLLDVDPIGLVRGRREAGAPSLFAYVNDRPYVASSFLSVAIAKVLRSALNGRCGDREELTEERLPLEARLPSIACRGGAEIVERLFAPLGYEVRAARHPLDERFPEWGEGPYHDVTLRGDVRLKDLLGHLYVLVPVLDNVKHYWIGEGEVEKLLAKGKDWLAEHPEKELITRRYLKHQRHLTREAFARLSEEDDPDPDSTSDRQAGEERALEDRISLNEQRIGTVVSVLKEAGARSVVDLGCGEGKLLRALLESKSGGSRDFDRLFGIDVSHRALEICSDRLRLDRMPAMQRKRIEIAQGSLTYRDERLSGFDGAALIEVIEHLDLDRLGALERVVFEFARPRVVVVTTPNREYNELWETLPSGHVRHRDHRFEWTREEFRAWCESVAEGHDYRVRYLPVGSEDPTHGPPTQMGVFTR
ncbi:MAG: 3' terminal RNA ribose 2'-O-methyltransferase Hen1 [Planctomycetota bacterium]